MKKRQRYAKRKAGGDGGAIYEMPNGNFAIVGPVALYDKALAHVPLAGGEEIILISKEVVQQLIAGRVLQ